MKNKIPSNRNFGLVFFVVFLVIALWTFRGELVDIKIIPLSISIIFLILGLLNSKILYPLNLLWIKFGETIGRILAPIVMLIVYFIVITPMGLFFRLIGRDIINIKFSKKNSYWIKREKNIGSMKRQF